MSTLFQVNSDLMHRRMGHPSDDVLHQAQNHTEKFLKDLIFDKDHHICRGCAEAKTHLPTFEDSSPDHLSWSTQISKNCQPFHIIITNGSLHSLMTSPLTAGSLSLKRKLMRIIPFVTSLQWYATSMELPLRSSCLMGVVNIHLSN